MIAKMIKLMARWIFRFSFYVIAYLIASVIAVYLSLRIIYQWWRHPSEKLATKRRELPPACLNNPSFGEHYYIQIKNVKLHYVENGDKTKPLMLFLHGFPDFWYSWRHQLKYFSKHYWTVAVDLRGYGDSEKPAGVSQYKIKYLMNDIKNLIQALGRDKCILIGHDWGSIIGWYFLLKYPDMIDRYVMIGVYPLFAKRGAWSQLVKLWYMYGFLLPYLPEIYMQRRDCRILDHIFKFSSPDEKEVYKFIFGKPGALTCPINYVRANALKLVFSHQAKAKDAQFPRGLVIYTDNDESVDSINFADVEKLVENLESVLISSATHYIHQCKPDETNKVIARFLDPRVSDNSATAKSVQFNDDETQIASN